MTSGSFPLSVNGESGKKLAEISKQLREIVHDFYDGVYGGDSGGCQFDNAASDGGYLEDLDIAADLIDKCVESYKWNVILKFPEYDATKTAPGSCPTTHRCSIPGGNVHTIVVTTSSWNVGAAQLEISEFVERFYPDATIVRFESVHAMKYRKIDDEIKTRTGGNVTPVKYEWSDEYGMRNSFYDTIDLCMVCHRQRYVNGGAVQCAECDNVVDSKGKIIPCSDCGSTDIEYQRENSPQCAKCKKSRTD